MVPIIIPSSANLVPHFSTQLFVLHVNLVRLNERFKKDELLKDKEVKRLKNSVTKSSQSIYTLSPKKNKHRPSVQYTRQSLAYTFSVLLWKFGFVFIS